jgi:hypothetical protein
LKVQKYLVIYEIYIHVIEGTNRSIIDLGRRRNREQSMAEHGRASADVNGSLSYPGVVLSGLSAAQVAR